MIIYTQTPDYYQEYLEHGWLKDQAAKVHKYLERWRGKNGKWYYRYASAAKNAGYKLKSKMTDAYVRFNRKRKGLSPDQVSYGYGKYDTKRTDNGKISSASTKEDTRRNAHETMYQDDKRGIKRTLREKEKRGAKLRPVLNSIDADRRRGEDRTSQLKSKGYKQGNLSKKGYYNSTSGDNSSAIKKSKIVANQKQKAADKRGYYNSKVDTPYKKKPSITKRGYEVGSGQSSDYYRRYNDYDKLYKGDDFILEPGENYWDKKYYKGYKGPLVLSPVGQENKAKRDLDKAVRAGWLTAARKRAGYVNKKRTKK